MQVYKILNLEDKVGKNDKSKLFIGFPVKSVLYMIQVLTKDY
jgi:hypothetical protein